MFGVPQSLTRFAWQGGMDQLSYETGNNSLQKYLWAIDLRNPTSVTTMQKAPLGIVSFLQRVEFGLYADCSPTDLRCSLQHDQARRCNLLVLLACVIECTSTDLAFPQTPTWLRSPRLSRSALVSATDCPALSACHSFLVVPLTSKLNRVLRPRRLVSLSGAAAI